jgi:hypothetical protein
MRKRVRWFPVRLTIILLAFSGTPHAADEPPPSFSQQELDQLVAPIALYPDAVLSQILMAATYPLEVVEAARWSKSHSGLEGQQAVAAVADQDWDPSVKALVAFPRILARMGEDLDWTQRLGDAFLGQEAQVMETVQSLRRKAYAAGRLDTLDHVRVIRDGDAILLEPEDPGIVYVPYYDTRVIYGPWWWPDYPPYYWAPPAGYYAGAGFYWYSGIRLSPTFYFSYFNWPRRHIVIVRPPGAFPHRPAPGHSYWDHRPGAGDHPWRPDPRHRRGVAHDRRGINPPAARPNPGNPGPGFGPRTNRGTDPDRHFRQPQASPRAPDATDAPWVDGPDRRNVDGPGPGLQGPGPAPGNPRNPRDRDNGQPGPRGDRGDRNDNNP